MRIIPRSIHRRMLVLSAMTTIVALVLAGGAILGVLQRFVTQGLDQRLDAQLSLLATAVQVDGSIDKARLTQVQGALAMDRGWQWRVSTKDEMVSSRDFPVIDPIPGPPPLPVETVGASMRAHPGEGHDARGERTHARSLTMNSTTGPVELVVAAPWQMVSKPINSTMMPLLTILGIVGVGLGGASVIQLRLGLRPLRRFQQDIAAIRSGTERELSEDQPVELQPLAVELNALIKSNEMTLATARSTAANLAHALKTPVATLALELRDDPEKAAQVDRLYATIRHHLARARDGIVARHAVTPVAQVLPDIVATIIRLHHGRVSIIASDIDDQANVAIDQADLEELLGNLIDNAARYAKHRVLITTHVDRPVVRIIITDDGPGISKEDRLRAMDPGMRLDERSDGDGFGLAISRELVSLNSGSLKLDEATGGGLVVIVELPAAAVSSKPLDSL